ncbi:MAG: hypothetical protein M3275_02985 [Thermoproteota archaeon]|nr:hypothetical protein [Thermoproteota archaeon]
MSSSSRGSDEFYPGLQPFSDAGRSQYSSQDSEVLKDIIMRIANNRSPMEAADALVFACFNCRDTHGIDSKL